MVTNEQELESALENVEVKQYIYEDIDLSSDSLMVIQGPEKIVVGNNHTITFETYRTFTVNTYLTESDLSVQCGYGGSINFCLLESGAGM